MKASFSSAESPGEPPGHVVERETLEELGALIRQTRQDRFTVHELAARAGISPGLLSQIERGLGNPSFKTLQGLASALDLRIGDLMAGGRNGARQMVVRLQDRKRLHVGAEGLTYELLTPDLQGRLEVLQTSVPAGFSNASQPFSHVGEECVVLLSGHLEVTVGEQSFEMSAGDSITYDSVISHWWRNATNEEALIIGAVTPPSF